MGGKRLPPLGSLQSLASVARSQQCFKWQTEGGYELGWWINRRDIGSAAGGPGRPKRMRNRGERIVDKIELKDRDEVLNSVREPGPGPGHYPVKSTVGSCGGGKFNLSDTKSDLDWITHYASQTPSPASYRLPEEDLGARGGKLVSSTAKSDVEVLIHRAKQLPGPGTYDPLTPSLSKSGSGKFNLSKVPSLTEMVVRRSRDVPGPASYLIPSQSSKQPGGKFNESRPKSDIDWKIHHAAQTPGPSDYGAPPLKPSPGGKIISTSGKSEVELAIHRAERLPGPGQYDHRQLSKLSRPTSAQKLAFLLHAAGEAT
eukprot:g3665.t1